MSEVLGFLVLAFCALAFVSKVAAEIRIIYTRNRAAAIVREFAIRRFRARCRHALCVLVHGRHELYRARSDSKLFQQCVLCGYETPGWSIDRRDRRLHLATRPRKAS